jgi:hypothetical protein
MLHGLMLVCDVMFQTLFFFSQPVLVLLTHSCLLLLTHFFRYDTTFKVVPFGLLISSIKASFLVVRILGSPSTGTYTSLAHMAHY